jgi:hypothetical protein
VVTNVNRFFSVSAAELRNVSHCGVIKRPERVFIEGLNALLQSDFNAIGKQVVLTEQIFAPGFLRTELDYLFLLRTFWGN